MKASTFPRPWLGDVHRIPRRWLVVGADYTWTQRDSNLNFDYDKNFYLLTATITP